MGPFNQLLYASGFLFMGATEEQMLLVNSSGIDHVAYVLILYSLAFLVFLFANVLVHIYDRSVNLNGHTKGINGHAHGSNGHTLAPAQERRLRDAEEFELDDMMSDEDEEEAQRRKLLKEEKDDVDHDGEGLSSPSTVGRNNDRVA
jgi:hypothetical protein